MYRNIHSQNSIFGMILRPQSAMLAILIMLLFHTLGILFIVLSAPMAHSQTFQVIHSFTGGWDGSNPNYGLTIDASGNLYGPASGGGHGNSGTVFRLHKSGAGWFLTTLCFVL